MYGLRFALVSDLDKKSYVAMKLAMPNKVSEI